MTPADVRTDLTSALRLDLVGPEPDDAARAAEVLPTSPSVQGLLVSRGGRKASRTQTFGGKEHAIRPLCAGCDRTHCTPGPWSKRGIALVWSTWRAT